MSKKKKEKPEVHRDLEGFELKINEFGEIISSLNIESLNEFLDKNVDDKKLKEREESALEEE
ncbi:MAG TPA: hypothetical protein PKE06_18445 [Flavilitoribacter sp.]|nr:hypothetical protein [Lewinella sp.]MCB9280029.1 hypothetical protein [Lewinellaceae bacterium]HMQ62665.1 hypothetical protein [Flavilitoribacter sp.]HMQ89880.1 hypothetical protein [Flavilitoribacter sp.]